MAKKLTKACRIVLRAERKLSTKMRSKKKPASMHKARLRLNKLRRKIGTVCPSPGMRL